MPRPSVLGIGGAVDFGAAVPLVGLFEVARRVHGPAFTAVVGLHVCASVMMFVSIAIGMPIVGGAAAAVSAVMWVVTTHAVDTNVGIPTTVLVGLSPVSFVTAWPLRYSGVQWHHGVAIVIRSVQAIVVLMMFLLINAEAMFDAWGCYAPSQPISEYNDGMCGDAFNNRQVGPGFICEKSQYVSDDGTCRPDGSSFRFYGDSVAFVIHAELLVVLLWAFTYYDLALLLTLTRPAAQRVGGGRSPSKSTAWSRADAVSATADLPFI